MLPQLFVCGNATSNAPSQLNNSFGCVLLSPLDSNPVFSQLPCLSFAPFWIRFYEARGSNIANKLLKLLSHPMCLSYQQTNSWAESEKICPKAFLLKMCTGEENLKGLGCLISDVYWFHFIIDAITLCRAFSATYPIILTTFSDTSSLLYCYKLTRSFISSSNVNYIQL